MVSGKKGTICLIYMLPLFLLAMVALVLEQILNICWGKVYYFFINWLNKNYYYHGWLKRDLADCKTILEIGCGRHSPILQIGYGKKTDTIDIWQPYIEQHNEFGDYHKCSLSDVLDFKFPRKAYDAVVMLDVLEHLSRNKVGEIDLFGQMEKCARKKVIIFTPNGFSPNDKIDGNPYQYHLSEWQPKDYKVHGYKVKGGTGFRYLFNNRSLPKHPELLFYILGMITQPLIYHFPRLAWHSYAVKEIK